MSWETTTNAINSCSFSIFDEVLQLPTV
uniref:Uncharacterized protein n=1 Tax=Arundo donax TaxID=35708 RepID=A0A0A9BDL3_ARUDO